MSTIASQSPLNISENFRDAWLQRGNGLWGISCHVTDDVTWRRKVQLVTPYA